MENSTLKKEKQAKTRRTKGRREKGGKAVPKARGHKRKEWRKGALKDLADTKATQPSCPSLVFGLLLLRKTRRPSRICFLDVTSIPENTRVTQTLPVSASSPFFIYLFLLFFKGKSYYSVTQQQFLFLLGKSPDLAVCFLFPALLPHLFSEQNICIFFMVCAFFSLFFIVFLFFFVCLPIEIQCNICPRIWYDICFTSLYITVNQDE